MTSFSVLGELTL